MAFNCCYGCASPKRYPGCHDHCPEYIEQKAQYEKATKEKRRKNLINAGIVSQKVNGVLRANRKKGRRS